ncbi:2-phospho-L-lactate guanylyltransferase [Mumia sp. zg.B17]|nr:2-phospho-L-lactate guanylyltransferase [Mumia sp. zg.B17]
MDPVAGRWALVVPVKDTAVGKSRLAPLGAQRPALARAMALDTLEAVVGSPLVARVVVVTSDGALADAVLSEVSTDVEVVPDPGAGLRAAVLAGADVAADSGLHLAVVTADLPGMRPEDLDAALTEADGYEMSMVADADGVGTTLLAVTDPTTLDPRFGERSLDAHRAAGAESLPAALGLRRDVDLPVHLDELRALLGPRTAAVVARLAIG